MGAAHRGPDVRIDPGGAASEYARCVLSAPESPRTVALDEDALARAREGMLGDLRNLGLSPGDRVAALCGTRPEMVVAREAVAAAGQVLVPLSPRLAPPEVAYVLAHARPQVVLVEPGAIPRATAAVERLLPYRRPALIELAPVAGLALESAPPGHAPPLPRPPPAAVTPEQVGATLLYTSGTTGRPKGCVRSAAQEAARARELIATYRLGPDDVHLIACPLAYSAPGIFLRAARCAGAATVLLSRFAADAWMDAASAARATVAFLVPTQWQRLLALPAPLRARERLSSLRVAITAGAPLAPALRRELVEWLGEGRLWEFYGSSETGTISILAPGEQLDKPDSVGRVAPGVELRLEPVAPADAGADPASGAAEAAAEPDPPCQIWVRSPTVMTGYWNPVTGVVDWPGTEDGFLSVGDLGRLDADGALHLTGRMHDTIISGGVNVYPAEVERALAEHAEVATSVVFGLADAEWGQRVAALVVRAEGSSVSAEDLSRHLAERLAPHKRPKQIAFIAPDELPRTPGGKPLRRAAAQLARRMNL